MVTRVIQISLSRHIRRGIYRERAEYNAAAEVVEREQLLTEGEAGTTVVPEHCWACLSGKINPCKSCSDAMLKRQNIRGRLSIRLD